MTGRKTKARLQPVRTPFVLGVIVSALLSACAGGSAPPLDNSARPPAAASVPAPIVKMMRIDEGAYPTPPPRSDETRVVGLLLP